MIEDNSRDSKNYFHFILQSNFFFVMLIRFSDTRVHFHNLEMFISLLKKVKNYYYFFFFSLILNSDLFLEIKIVKILGKLVPL